VSVRAFIVAAGGANYGSLREACRRVGVDAEVGDEPARIRNATHVILPGVGAAAQAMAALRTRGLDRVLQSLDQPLLGICLGMQLLFDVSEESAKSLPEQRETVCLGILPGTVRRLPPAPSWPHMGWNRIVSDVTSHPLLSGLAANDWYYFVHGYAAPADESAIAHCDHGMPFSAVVARDNVYGTQFHPEKSAAAGRRLLANFFAMT
jgi:imidazole glycerol-phosphate synthase subunit HisH